MQEFSFVLIKFTLRYFICTYNFQSLSCILPTPISNTKRRQFFPDTYFPTVVVVGNNPVIHLI